MAGMAQSPDEDTEPRVQQLFIGPYQETDMGSQDLANAGLCVSEKKYDQIYQKMGSGCL